jgi:ATP-dependent Lon protease
VGKTRIARKALATAMGKPFIEIPMGGATNADFLRGSLYVYEGSGPGRLVQGLQSVRAMNPVVFMDEIDKISQTQHGHEITSVLMQLVDGSQNDGFEDKYFPGIKLDVSQIQFVFAANEIDRIDPVLRDRLDVIHINGYSRDEKRQVLERHLLSEISDDVGHTASGFSLTECAIEELLDRVESEQGVRRLREMLRHTIQHIAAVKTVTLSEHSSDAYKVLGVNSKLYKMMNESLVQENDTLAINKGIVSAVLDKRSNLEANRFDSSSLYM